MARLCINDFKELEELGVIVPNFDIEKIKTNTQNNPEWVHFGPGNIFRIFVGSVTQKAIEEKRLNTGIIAVATYDQEIVEKAYKPFDNLTLAVTMKSTGELEKKVIGSIVDTLTLNDYQRLVSIFENDTLKLVSFTITEKGYSLKDSYGELFEFIKVDLDSAPDDAKNTMVILTNLLYKRYLKNKCPLTLMSMDNCSHNGDKIKLAVEFIAQNYIEKNIYEDAFLDYIKSQLSYPYTMIDKITPRPNEIVKEQLEKLGIENMDTILTSKNTFTAPFVNAEEAEYLIMEDDFRNGKVDFTTKNVLFTDRDTVNNVETMKVTTCLNPLHTALAVTGCLLNHTYISDEMKDPTLVKLISKIGYEEGLKVVVDPIIINPKEFIDEVVNMRFTNPYVKDMPQRIATDTSQKVGIRFGVTIKKYFNSDNLNVDDLIGIPLSIASWLRYLLGVDDKGEEFEISADPMLDELKLIMNKIKLGDEKGDIKPILSNEKIFGSNLYEVRLGEKIEGYFNEMIKGTGAVRNTLDKYL